MLNKVPSPPSTTMRSEWRARSLFDIGDAWIFSATSHSAKTCKWRERIQRDSFSAMERASGWLRFTTKPTDFIVFFATALSTYSGLCSPATHPPDPHQPNLAPIQLNVWVLLPVP